MKNLKHAFPLMLVAGVVMFTNLGGPRLWDRDEPRNAGCAAEMLARGDWVTPIFNDELRSHKPVLLYWLMMSAYSLFGVSEFAARVWSAGLATGTVLLTYIVGRHLFGPRVGWWAGIILATCLMFDVAGRAATPDATLIFLMTLATTIYVVATFRSAGDTTAGEPRTAGVYFPRRWSVACAIYASMGLAVLAKGPIGLVLPTAVIGMFILVARLEHGGKQRTLSDTGRWQQRVRSMLAPFRPTHFFNTCWRMRPLTALAVVAIVAAPWYVLVGLRTNGDWLRGFFLEHNLGRAMQSMEGHGGNLLFYPISILIGFFPWSVLAIPTIIECVHQVRTRQKYYMGVVFVTAWIGVYVGLFSIARTKLPSYITPCYPGVALLVGVFVDRWLHGQTATRRYWPYVSLSCLAIVGCIIGVGLPLAARHRYLPGDEWLGALGLIPLAVAIVGFWGLRKGRRQLVAGSMAVGATAFCIALFGFAPLAVDQHQQVSQLLRSAENESADVELGALGCLEPSWVFYSRQPIRRLSVDRHEPAREHNWNKRAIHRVTDFLAEEHRFVITTTDRWQEVQADLPMVQVMAKVPYFLKDAELVLLQRVPDKSGSPAVAGKRRSDDSSSKRR